MKKPLIVIGGPTACGKTGFSIRLAKEIGGEVISADSMQIYRYMDIGTAKVTPEEADGVPHYLIDELNPDEEYNVMLFQQKAKAYMEEIWAKEGFPFWSAARGFISMPCCMIMILPKRKMIPPIGRSATVSPRRRGRRCCMNAYGKSTCLCGNDSCEQRQACDACLGIPLPDGTEIFRA